MIQTNYQEFLEQKLFLYLLSRKSKTLISWNLTPGTLNVTLYGKRDFADTIKDFELGKSLWII